LGIRFKQNNVERHTAVAAPHWMLASLFAAIAIMPWMGRRFSLRTLLIAMTLVAVALGIVAVWDRMN
jgi:hypothetical protein